MAAIVKEKLYTVDSLVQYIQDRLRSYVQRQTTIPSEAGFKLQQTVQKYIENCACGDEADKLYVKQMMRQMLTEKNGANAEDFPASYCVNEENIDEFIDWEHPESISAYVLFLAVLYHYKKEFGSDAFGHIVDKYGFNNLRQRGDEGLGFFIDDTDIHKVWDEEKLQLTYNDKLEVLLQLVYEETKGNSCIDELLYQNVGDISAGISGVPDNVNMATFGDSYPAYRGCWVRFRDASIHLLFLSFGSSERLKEVVKQIVSYQMKGQFSEKEGFKLGYGKDGSRRTAAIEPFGESPALWVRKFTEKGSSNEDLCGDIPGADLVQNIERVLIRGGATVPICGAQGSGKTTKLEAVAQYIQNFYAIRVLETEFEARLRWKYPLKNIYTMEANESTPVSPSQAYNFSLRSAGDVYIIGEARSDEMIINVTRTANRGGRSVLFTFHPKSPEMTIPEIANAMIREKMYTSLKDAIYTALNTIKVCIFVTVDLETHQHFYEIYEFVPHPNVIPSEFMRAMQKDERDSQFMRAMHAYMQTMANADTYYRTVPIIVYDRKEKKYVMQNTVTDRLYRELRDKTPIEQERAELERVFRPGDFIKGLAKDEGVELTQKYIDEMVKKHGLQPQFVGELIPSTAMPGDPDYVAPRAETSAYDPLGPSGSSSGAQWGW